MQRHAAGCRLDWRRRRRDIMLPIWLQTMCCICCFESRRLRRD